MYIGRYNPYYSFATITQSNCMEIGKGRYEWNGGDGVATGSSCVAARQAYCNKYGKNGKCYGDIGGPPHDNPSIPSQQNRAAVSNGGSVGGGSSGGQKTGLGKPCNPAKAGDPISYWNLLACQFESTTGLPDYGLSVIAGLGGVLLLVLLVKKR